MLPRSLSPEEEIRQIVARLPRPQPGTPPPSAPTPDAAAAPASPVIAPPTPKVTPVQVPQQRQTDQAELDRLKNTGAGVEQLQHKHPILGTIARIGDAALSSMFPAVAANIPGTELHHSQLVNRAQGRVANDLAGEQKEAQTANEAATTAHTQAETEAIPAHTKLEEAQTDALANKPDKDVTLQQSYADAVNDAVKRGVNPLEDPKVQQLADSIQNIQKQPATTQEALDKQYNDAIKSGDHEAAQRILKVKHDLAVAGQPPQRPPQVTMVVPGANGTQTLETLRPGQQVPTGARTPTQFGPTAQERNVSAQAMVAAEGIPSVISEIDQLKDQLGPVQGRWGEFMQGKVGMENTKLSGLRADLLMVSSAVALAHARGRLPENLREEFDAAINNPHQSAENLKTVLQHILPWMQRMTQMTDYNQQPNGGSQEVEYVRGTDGRLHPKQ